MSDDLVKRLRDRDWVRDYEIAQEAADRIEKLETDLKTATMKRLLDSDRIEKLEAALRGIIGALDDPKGGQHVYDMRNASYIARKALDAK